MIQCFNINVHTYLQGTKSRQINTNPSERDEHRTLNDALKYDNNFTITRNIRTLLMNALRQNFDDQRFRRDFDVIEIHFKISQIFYFKF